MSGNAEADVLDALKQTNDLLNEFTNSAGGNNTDQNSQLLRNMDVINQYMQNLFKQHNQTTQFLTYANQLWKLESYLSKKLHNDYMQVSNGSNTMSTTIYVVRQRYMDKTSTVFYRAWVTMVVKRTLLALLLIALLVALSSSQVITKTVFLILMAVVIIWYMVWFYYQIDTNSRRDPTDPSVFMNWNYYPKAGSNVACTA